MRPDRLLVAALGLGLAACSTSPPLRGTGDLGVVVERAAGSILIVDTTEKREIGRVEGLGDLSDASVVFSRDGRAVSSARSTGAMGDRVALPRGRDDERHARGGGSPAPLAVRGAPRVV